MNIVVTGSSGFIGKHLVKRLESEGHFLLCYDIKTGPPDWMELPETRHADFIFHLASPVGCRKVMLEKGVYSNIIRGAAAAIECANRLGAKLVAFSSAEAEYPHFVDPKRGEYPRGKQVMEQMCLSSPCDVAIIRPHNVIGPGQDPDAGFVVPRFFRAKREGKPLTVFGYGTQQRIFTSVHDVVDFCMMMLSWAPYDGIKWSGKHLFEIGNPHNVVTINELARMIGGKAEMVDGASGYGIGSYMDMPSRNSVDILPALNLGWEPKHLLTDILKEIEDEYRNDRA